MSVDEIRAAVERSVQDSRKSSKTVHNAWFKRLRTRFLIWRLRAKAKAYYRMYWYAFEHYDCGRTLAEEISPSMMMAKAKFNATMDCLCKVDPSATKIRL